MNEILGHFANAKWKGYDEEWLNGRISSCKCIKKQISLLRSASKEEILKLIDMQEIDPYFKSFYKFCLDLNIEVEILSDGLDFYIGRILNNNGIAIKNIKSNIYKGAGKVIFPYLNRDCLKKCANCKSSHINIDKFSIYIGDGKSDYCAASKCDIVFAKKALADYLKTNKIPYNLFDDFNDVLVNIKKLFSKRMR